MRGFDLLGRHSRDSRRSPSDPKILLDSEKGGFCIVEKLHVVVDMENPPGHRSRIDRSGRANSRLLVRAGHAIPLSADEEERK